LDDGQPFVIALRDGIADVDSRAIALEHAAELSTIVSNTCITRNAGPGAITFQMVTTANATQRRALELIDAINV
jgi:hypothetical protein